MKTFTPGKVSSGSFAVELTRAFIIAGFLFYGTSGQAQSPPTDYPANTPLASWQFLDQTNWTSDRGSAPISFTNLNSSWLGDGASLLMDTNLPAWLNFNVIEPGTGATNLVLGAPGSLTFWYAPAWTATKARLNPSSMCNRTARSFSAAV